MSMHVINDGLQYLRRKRLLGQCLEERELVLLGLGCFRFSVNSIFCNRLHGGCSFATTKMLNACTTILFVKEVTVAKNLVYLLKKGDTVKAAPKIAGGLDAKVWRKWTKNNGLDWLTAWTQRIATQQDDTCHQVQIILRLFARQSGHRCRLSLYKQLQAGVVTLNAFRTQSHRCSRACCTA